MRGRPSPPSSSAFVWTSRLFSCVAVAAVAMDTVAAADVDAAAAAAVAGGDLKGDEMFGIFARTRFFTKRQSL